MALEAKGRRESMRGVWLTELERAVIDRLRAAPATIQSIVYSTLDLPGTEEVQRAHVDTIRASDFTPPDLKLELISKYTERQEEYQARYTAEGYGDKEEQPEIRPGLTITGR